MLKPPVIAILLATGSAAWSQPFPNQPPPEAAQTTYEQPVAWERIQYGELSTQAMIFHRARESNAPLIVYFDNVVWRDGEIVRDNDLAGFAHSRGYASAFVSWDLQDQPTAEEILGDLGRAVARLVADAAELGIDPDEIVLVARGGAGGLAALLATDPRHLEAAGVDFAALRGVILLNGDGFDLVARATDNSGRLRGELEDVFGADDALRRHSPINHLAPPNAPAFLLVVESRRASFTEHSHGFSELLTSAGIDNRLVLIPRNIRSTSVHMFGTRDTEWNAAAAEFLERAFSR